MIQKSMYSENFEKLVKQWHKRYPLKSDPRSYIGVGNPNAKILIVGRECAREKTPEQIRQDGEISFADSWLEKIENNHLLESEKLRCPYPAKDKYIPLNGHTWVKYQKLYDLMTKPGEKPKYGLGSPLNFLEHVFATEMNPNPALKTDHACTEGMSERKDHFFTSDFIRDFPIVILACGYDYIRNNDDDREIDKIFNVKYKQLPNDGKNSVNGQSFWAHFNDNKTRIVINTHQLSGRIKNDLLSAIADACRPFLK